jgi:hypothetical protein
MSKLKQHFLPFYPLIGVYLLFFTIMISGCVPLAPDETPTPTLTATTTPTLTATPVWFPATPTPTSIANNTPTPQPTFETQREGIAALLIDDDFSDDSLWQTFQSSSGNAAFGTQNLTLAVAQQNASLTSISQHALPENFYMEISIQISLCQPQDQVGILFMYSGMGDMYRLLMTCSGQYRLELIQGGQSIVIHDWERSSQMSLNMPASNRVGLWLYRGRLQFFINDVFQFEERIAQNRAGGLGLFVRSIEGNAVTIRFSDLQIYQVDLGE